MKRNRKEINELYTKLHGNQCVVRPARLSEVKISFIS
jgi:hypothetical protein